ncbi:SET domain-containing protein 9-like [Perognathus longimembris pacificus]|uniref:SET domain-containing protein 9-like n=1 Tax=Perognathus longimembris pacificus TaxID=214514 RepID=UPI0020197EFD|nr:SET domain-containing protein 9-like [Perognathus longimembris pacificus]
MNQQGDVSEIETESVGASGVSSAVCPHWGPEIWTSNKIFSAWKGEPLLLGTVNQRYEPIFFQSIGNPFIFRCLDGVLIDGNDKGISKVVYRFSRGRDLLGPLKMSDSTWLTSEIHNPLAVGQYVNNCSNNRAANVCYQEFDVPAVFPIELKQYIPNISYNYNEQRPLRCVVLVALRDINQGEELLSNDYTFIS